MQKKHILKILATPFVIGAWTFSPVVYHVENNIFVSVAHAEIKTYTATGRAEFNFGENNPQLIEMAKNYARMKAVQAAKEQAGIYLTSYSKTLNGYLSADDISVVASNSAEIIAENYKKVPYVSHDVKDNATGEIGIAYIATVTVKIDSEELSRYIKRDQKEKSTLIEQVKSSQKNIAEINQNIADLNKNPEKATATEIEKIDNKILAEQKNDEGWRAWDNKNFEQALKLFDEAVKLNSNNCRGYCGRGTAYSDLQNYEQAIKDFNQAIKINPNYSLAYNNRGLAYYYLKNYTQAISDYNQAIELNPNDSEVYYNRGLAYKNLQNYEQAISDYNKAIKLNQNYVEAYYNRGNAYNDLKNYEQAISDYNKAIELNPDYAKAYNNRGNAYKDLKNYEQAISDFNKAIELNPNLAVAYRVRGLAYIGLQNYEQAISDYNKVVELNPNFAEAYYIRGLCYQELGQTDKAEADFAKAKELGYKE